MQHEMDSFLQTLFGGVEDSAWFHLWTLHDKRSHWFTANSLDDYFQEAASGTIGDEDVYVSMGLARERGGATERIKAHDAYGIVALWADIDYQHGVHKKGNLPKDADHALAIIDQFPLKPSIIVSSGHGFQCYWLLKEPVYFDTEEERAWTQTLCRRWAMTLREVASKHGCTIDSVFDLSRVMRVPGTFNCKDRENPQPCVVREQSNEYYNLSDFEPFLVDESRYTGEKIAVEVGEVDPALQPPFDKFQVLYENDKTFRDLWTHKKKPANDDSLSAYEMALANIVVRVGWSDEEVLALLVKHRIRYGEFTKHKKYYELTISKARQGFRADNVAQASDAPHITPEDMLVAVSDKLGVTIRGLIEYTSAPPSYRLQLGDGEVHLGGAEVFVTQNLFRKKVLEAAGVLVHTLKANEWTQVVNMLMKTRSRQDVGEEQTEVGKLRDWLNSFLLNRNIETRGLEEAVVSKSIFIHDDALWIYTRSFQRFLHDAVGERINNNDVSAYLSHIGAEPQKLWFVHSKTNRRTSTDARRLPPEMFAPEDFLRPDQLESYRDRVSAAHTI